MATKTIPKRRRQDGRTSDLTLQWLVNNHGKEWETWRKLAEEWITSQDATTHIKLQALCLFLELYLVGTVPFTSDVTSLFEGKNGWQASSDEFKRIVLEKTNRGDNKSTTTILNYCKQFIDWVLESHLSEKSDNGNTIRLYANPFEQVKYKGNNTESVHNPLPYRYICDLRHILCPKPRGHFSDWKWAQEQTGQRTQHGNWFDVDESFIDKSDKDCVWRSKDIKRNGKRITIHQIWSPVPSMVLFIKLHLPLRTYQVRMLDSGEADTLRYEKGNWIKNPHNFALNRYSKGVFRQFKDNATGLESTGLYISTNKTADQNKDEFERGYEIPWQNEDVLYWLEKLRNWQEKYNPISKPTDYLTLETKHTGKRRSKAYLSAMGHSCFLFRDASANKQEDRSKPIPESSNVTLWYKLLHQLEQNLLASGDTLSDGTALRLVHDYGEDYKHACKVSTEFPLHSLRVSLITCYIMDAKLPLPVVSKLLAGHSRIIMTVYYTKLTPVVMKDKMTEADKLLDDKSQESVRTFLKDAEMRQVECKMAYHDGQSIEAALVNRNPLGWENRHHGVCLAGGNTVRSDESATVAGCWNGGELLKESKSNALYRVYDSVPHGVENCVRCRWFITDARYLPALNAHLNLMSYKSHEAANLAVKLEGEIEMMDDLKYEAECEGHPFTQHNELQALQRRYEKQLVEVDEYTKDWIATFGLIRRIIEIEQERTENDTTNKLVAVGSESDIKVGFMETESELLQLSLLCEDAEFYPDMLDDVKKTPVVQDRTQNLSRIMLRKGYMPHLLMLDKDQQLIAANAMMRQMALQANPTDKLDGYKKVANYLELERFMEDSKLLEIGINALETSINTPVNGISIKSLTSNVVKGDFPNAG